MNPKDRHPEGDGIVIRERTRKFVLKDPHRTLPRLPDGGILVEHIQPAVHNDACPVKQAANLVDLERHPPIVAELGELLSW
jgi:hypothetical protein